MPRKLEAEKERYIVNNSAAPFKPLRAVITCVALTYLLSWAWFAFLMSRGGYVSLDGIGPLVFIWTLLPHVQASISRGVSRHWLEMA